MKRDFNKMRTLLKALGYQLTKTGGLMVWETDLRDITKGTLISVKGKQDNLMIGKKVKDKVWDNHKYVVRFCYNPILNTLFKEVVTAPKNKKVRELSAGDEFSCIDYVNRKHSKDLSYHYLQDWDSITHLTLSEQSEVLMRSRQAKGQLIGELLNYTRGKI